MVFVVHHGDETHNCLYGDECSKDKMSKLQRLACLGITGAMKPAPIPAAEVLLGAPSSSCEMMAEAQAVIYNQL
jgi:hypothetical protein